MKKLTFMAITAALTLVSCTQGKVSELIQKAEQGDAQAQLEYGRLLKTTGNGVEQDWSLAVTMLQRSAEQGNPETQYKICNCYQTGQGTEQDLTKARQWYQLSADQGYPDAIEALRSL